MIDETQNAVMHNQRGLVHMRDEYYFAAIEEFKLAISLCPNSAATATFYNNLGLAYLKISKYDWAIACFQKSISLNSNFIEFYQNLIKAYKGKNMLRNASEEYAKIIGYNSSNSKAWLILGLINKELGKYEEAAQCLEEFVKLEPDLALTRSIKKIIKNLE